MSFLTNNFLADGFRIVLEYLHNNIITNYIVIVLFVLIVLKIVLTPLDIKQRESSAKMMKLQPKIADIKKRYADPMIQNKKIQELYAKEQVKMTAGCLPSIIQMLVLLAFFGALQQIAHNETARIVARAAANPGEVVELTGFLWIKNIWQADSGAVMVMPSLKEWERIIPSLAPEMKALVEGIDYEAIIQPTLNAYSGYGNGWYILPIIQGVTMYFSMGYSMSATAPQDNPMSGPIMKIAMAGMTTWFCLTANTLFTIYWIFTNILMFVQTFAFKWYFKYKEEKQAKAV